MARIRGTTDNISAVRTQPNPTKDPMLIHRQFFNDIRKIISDYNRRKLEISEIYGKKEEEEEVEANITSEDIYPRMSLRKMSERDKCEKVWSVEGCENQVSDDSDKSDSCQNYESDSVQELAIKTVTKTTNDTKVGDSKDNDNILCVMDDKSVEERNESKNDNSCSGSEKDDKSNENEESNDDEAREEYIESQTDLEIDASECAMDIEESDICGVVYTDQDRDLRTYQAENGNDKVETDQNTSLSTLYIHTAMGLVTQISDDMKRYKYNKKKLKLVNNIILS